MIDVERVFGRVANCMRTNSGVVEANMVLRVYKFWPLGRSGTAVAAAMFLAVLACLAERNIISDWRFLLLCLNQDHRLKSPQLELSSYSTGGSDVWVENTLNPLLKPSSRGPLCASFP